jgi:membrane dipeptidase
MHLEGADGIDEELAALRLLHAAGLRSLGLTWSRPNRFAQGVGVGDRGDQGAGSGEGLTPAGVALVRECERLGVLIDVSHLNDAGFWDVIGLATGPIVATHSNARALAPHPRNLTDDMIRALAETGGLVGLNFHVGFVRADLDHKAADTPLTLLAEHLDYIAGLVGVEHVALGSDYDGCTPPTAIGDVGKLPALLTLLAERGWGAADLAKLCRDNYRRLLGQVWGAA